MAYNIDSLKELAEAAEGILPGAEVFEYHCRTGDWLFYGGIISAIILTLAHINSLWFIPITLVLGWAANEYERKRILTRVRARESIKYPN